jgi:hypothetical protein
MPEELTAWQKPSKRLLPAWRAGRPGLSRATEGRISCYPSPGWFPFAAPKGGSCGGMNRWRLALLVHESFGLIYAHEASLLRCLPYYPRAPVASSLAPRPAACYGGLAHPRAKARQWRSMPPAGGRMAHRRRHPRSPPLLDGDRDSASYCVPGKVPASSPPRSRNPLFHSS